MLGGQGAGQASKAAVTKRARAKEGRGNIFPQPATLDSEQALAFLLTAPVRQASFQQPQASRSPEGPGPACIGNAGLGLPYVSCSFPAWSFRPREGEWAS